MRNISCITSTSILQDIFNLLKNNEPDSKLIKYNKNLIKRFNDLGKDNVFIYKNLENIFREYCLIHHHKEVINKFNHFNSNITTFIEKYLELNSDIVNTFLINYRNTTGEELIERYKNFVNYLNN